LKNKPLTYSISNAI